MDEAIMDNLDVQEEMKSRLRDVDLNLLTVFDAVMQARSITGAARLLGMSQPAVSNAVSRLRATFNDELFVRYGRGIKPTSRASQLFGVVRHALQLVQNELPGAGFDPLSSERQFIISVASPLESRIMPIIMDDVKFAAPNINLGFRSVFNQEIEHQLRHQEVDFLLCYDDVVLPEFKSVPLFEDDMVCVTGEHHPGFNKPLTEAEFYRERHAVVCVESYGSFSTPWYDTPEKQSAIFYQGMSISCVLNVVSLTDLVAIAPRWLAESVANDLKLKVFSFVPSRRQRTCCLAWNKSASQDKGHLWMQELIIKTCSHK